MRAFLGILFAFALAFSACAQSLQLVGVSGPLDATATFIAGTQQTSASSTYTYSSQSYGGSCRDRYLIIAANWQSVTASVTGTIAVDGTNATQIVLVGDTANLAWSGIWIFSNPISTTGSIVLTLSASAANSSIQTYVACNVQSAAALTALSSTTNASTMGALTTRLTGFVITISGASFGSSCSAGGSAFTWSNTTEQNKIADGTALRCVSSALATNTAAGTLTTNVTITGASVARPRTAAASFR